MGVSPDDVLVVIAAALALQGLVLLGLLLWLLRMARGLSGRLERLEKDVRPQLALTVARRHAARRGTTPAGEGAVS
jgi:hypothetical protein